MQRENIMFNMSTSKISKSYIEKNECISILGYVNEQNINSYVEKNECISILG